MDQQEWLSQRKVGDVVVVVDHVTDIYYVHKIKSIYQPGVKLDDGRELYDEYGYTPFERDTNKVARIIPLEYLEDPYNFAFKKNIELAKRKGITLDLQHLSLNGIQSFLEKYKKAEKNMRKIKYYKAVNRLKNSRR